jgi:hypothetical protein
MKKEKKMEKDLEIISDMIEKKKEIKKWNFNYFPRRETNWRGQSLTVCGRPPTGKLLNTGDDNDNKIIGRTSIPLPIPIAASGGTMLFFLFLLQGLCQFFAVLLYYPEHYKECQTVCWPKLGRRFLKCQRAAFFLLSPILFRETPSEVLNQRVLGLFGAGWQLG